MGASAGAEQRPETQSRRQRQEQYDQYHQDDWGAYRYREFRKEQGAPRRYKEFSKLDSQGAYHDDEEILTQDFDMQSVSARSNRSDRSHRTNHSTIWSEVSAASRASMRSAELQDRLEIMRKFENEKWQSEEQTKDRFLREMKDHLGNHGFAGDYRQQYDDRWGDGQMSQASQSGFSRQSSRGGGDFQLDRRRMDPVPQQYSDDDYDDSNYGDRRGDRDRYDNNRRGGTNRDQRRSLPDAKYEKNDNRGSSTSNYRREGGGSSAGGGPRSSPRGGGGGGGGGGGSVHSPSEVEDLQAKLRMAHRQVEESLTKLKSEQERADRLHNELQHAKSNIGGNDLEVQLMQNIVALKERCTVMENGKVYGEKRARDLEAELGTEREFRVKAETGLESLQEEKKELVKGMEVLSQQCTAKNKEVNTETSKREEIQNGMKLVTVERDETLELLQRAVEQNQKLKLKVRDGEKEVVDAKESFQRELQRQNGEVRQLLHSVDQLLAKVGRAGTGGDSEGALKATIQDTVRDLITIRDGMRRLIPNPSKKSG